MSLKIISCLFECFIVKAPVLHSTPTAPAQYVSNTEMSDAQLRQSDSASESVSETSLQLGIVITVTTRAEVRATTTGTVEMTLRIRVLTGMPADAYCVSL